MSLSIGNIILYSEKPTELGQFFSELLDLNIIPEPNGDGIILVSQSIQFSIQNSVSNKFSSQKNNQDMIINFTMSSKEELENLIYKVHFLSYRHGKDTSKAKHQLSKVGGELFFFLRDIDGRRWKFSWKES